jgi:hypothetical protein
MERALVNKALTMLAAGMLATIPVTIGEKASFGLTQAFAFYLAGLPCAKRPATGSGCRLWQCTYTAWCDTGRTIWVKVPDWSISYTPGQVEYVNYQYHVHAFGCMRWVCNAPGVCPPGYVNVGGICLRWPP